MTNPTISKSQKEKLLGSLRTGKICDFGGKDPSDPQLNSNHQTVPASLLYQICTGNYPDLVVHSKGVLLKGAIIAGRLDFQSATIVHPLELIDCKIEEAINLNNTHVKTMMLDGCSTQGINAKDMVSDGTVSLGSGFISNKEVSFERSKIHGDFNCENAGFSCVDGEKAMDADDISVDGRVLFKGCQVHDGEVSFRRATIGSNFDCSGASFDNASGTALNLSGAEIGGSVVLAEKISEPHHVPFTSKGIVNLNDTNIKANLDCKGANLTNAKNYALTADHLKVKGSVILKKGFLAEGGVSLCMANIDGHLKFSNADIRKIPCQCGLENEKDAINAYGIVIQGHLEFEGTSVIGKVNFFGADIGGNFNCTGAKINHPGKVAFCISDADIKGALYWKKLAQKPQGKIVFARAKVGEFEDDKESWPDADTLDLDGFVYGSLIGNSPKGYKDRLEWLNHQSNDGFRPQPYVQLIQVLRRVGHKMDSREIAIAKQKKLNSMAHLPTRMWSFFLRITLGYGYKPWRAFIPVLITIAAGYLIFEIAHAKKEMVPTDTKISKQYIEKEELPENYPKFGPLVYSVDAFLPVVQLDQVKHWRPKPKLKPDSEEKPKSNLTSINFSKYETYLWFHILLGWLLTTVTITGISGLIKKD